MQCNLLQVSKMKIKNNQRKIEKFILIFVFVIMKLVLASAVNVGISPATVTFENVLRNGYSESFHHILEKR